MSLLDSTIEGFVFCHCSVYTLQNIWHFLFDLEGIIRIERNLFNKLMFHIFKKSQDHPDAMGTCVLKDARRDLTLLT